MYSRGLDAPRTRGPAGSQKRSPDNRHVSPKREKNLKNRETRRPIDRTVARGTLKRGNDLRDPRQSHSLRPRPAAEPNYYRIPTTSPYGERRPRRSPTYPCAYPRINVAN